MQADNERPQMRERAKAKKYRKNFWKTFQKPLDKRKEMWYNNQVAQNAAMRTNVRADHWQLNNKRLKYKQKLSAKESRNFFEKRISNLSRIRDILNKV